MPVDSNARSGRDGAPRPQPGKHGRYVIGDEIASGGMATVHLGKMLGDAGFARTVAIKRLHPQFAKDPEVCAMLLDEGRLAARIHHLNVVTTLDVVASGDELFVVMEYVHGEPLSALIRAAIRRRERIPPRIVAAILAGALRGLHAAHEARDARGEPLGVVHRDVSPQNILVGSDGVARVLDFGVAKAKGRAHVTQDGRIKGKFGYMPPEQLHGEVLDRRSDVYASGVVLWEALVGARLFAGRGDMPDFARLLEASVEPPSSRVHGLSPAHDAVVLRALARDAERRFPTALAMAEALEGCGPVAPPAEVGSWVMDVAGDLLAELAGRIAAIESRLSTGIRESIHLIEASESRMTRLDGLAPTLASTPPPGTLHAAGLGPSVTMMAAPVPPATPFEPADLPSVPSNATPGPTVWGDPQPTRGSMALWIGTAALGAAAIAATLAVIASVPGTPASGGSDPSASARAATAGEAASAGSPEPASAPLPVATPPTTATATAAPTATAEPSARAAPVAPPAHTGSPHVAAAAPPPARHPAADGCSPPFTLDAAGHKHYKRECFR
jgi:serine/threonine protein kinase